MPDKKQITVALVIIGLVIVFVIIKPSILTHFVETFNKAYNESLKHNETSDTTKEVTPDVYPVSITIEVQKDSDVGFNVVASPQNFLFYYGTPPADAGVKFAGVIGYGDVLVDGKFVGRMYQPWFYIQDLTAGNHEVVVRLFNADHTPLIQDNTQVKASKVIAVQ